jgi:LEA14-like dessication related protein
MKRISLIILTFLTGLLLLGGCGPKEDIEFKYVKDVIVDANTEPLLKGTAVLYNPNKQRMKLRKINVDVYVNDKKTARIDQEPSLLIPSEAEFTIPLEVKLNIKELGFMDTLFGVLGGKKMKIRYKGTISITYKGIPVRVPVDYESSVNFKF